MKTIKLILTVILCVLTITACKAESTPASASGDITTASVAKEDREDKTEREETEKAPDETKAGTAKTEESAADVVTPVPFPETVFRYTADKNDTFIDSQTGEILLTLNKSDERYAETKPKNFVRFEEGFMRYTISEDDGYIFIDMNGNIVPRPANALPDDIVADYPQVSADGVYIAKDGNFYGLKNTNGDIIADFIYKDIKPNADYTLFAFSLNKKGGVMNTAGETIINNLESHVRFYENYIFSNFNLYNLNGELIAEQISKIHQFNNNLLVEASTIKTTIDDKEVDTAIINTNGEIIKNLPKKDFYDYEKLGEYYFIAEDVDKITSTFSCIPLIYQIKETDYNHYNVFIFMDENGNILPIQIIQDDYQPSSGYSKSNNYSSVIDKTNNKTYLIDNNNAIATIEGYQVQLLNDYILYSTVNKILTLYDFNMNEIATISNKYKISNNTIVYSDADTGLYGVIIGDKIIHDARFTSASINEAGTVITAERGNDKFYYAVATSAEIVFPE